MPSTLVVINRYVRMRKSTLERISQIISDLTRANSKTAFVPRTMGPPPKMINPQTPRQAFQEMLRQIFDVAQRSAASFEIIGLARLQKIP
ncbi:MAG TPA: hypothetical protein VGB93_08315, partial [Methylovirgula sp.]